MVQYVLPINVTVIFMEGYIANLDYLELKKENLLNLLHMNISVTIDPNSIKDRQQS